MLTCRFWEALSNLTEALLYEKNQGRILHPGHALGNDSSNSRKAEPLAEATQRHAAHIQREWKLGALPFYEGLKFFFLTKLLVVQCECTTGFCTPALCWNRLYERYHTCTFPCVWLDYYSHMKSRALWCKGIKI